MTQLSYRTRPAALVDYRGGDTGLTLADSDTWGAAPITVSGAESLWTARETFGNPNLGVSARFSITAATVVMYVGLWLFDRGANTWFFLGLADVQTATASADQIDDNGRFVTEDLLLFDLSGATHYELRIALPSSGSVQLVPITFGLDPNQDPIS